MARIQVLRLPERSLGQVRMTPFALVIDDAEGMEFSDREISYLNDFADRCGAEGALVCDKPLDVA